MSNMKEFVELLTPEQKKALLEALTGEEAKPENEYGLQQKESVSASNDNEEEVPEMPNDFTMKRSKINTMKQNSRREQVKAHQNQWVDTGNEHADIKTPQKTLTPRNRKPPKKKNVTCHKCGKTQQVNANLVYGEFYRCDRCVG